MQSWWKRWSATTPPRPSLRRNAPCSITPSSSRATPPRSLAPITKSCAAPASTTAASCRSPSSPPGSITSIAWPMPSAWAATDFFASPTTYHYLNLLDRDRFAAAVLEDLSRDFHPLAGKLHQPGILSMRRNSIFDGQQNGFVIGQNHQRRAGTRATLSAGYALRLRQILAVGAGRINHPAFDGG